MCGNSQRQPGREPQRQPPETAPPALPDHHPPNPPNPTAPTTPTTHTNPTNHTAAPTKSSNPATPSTPPTPTTQQLKHRRATPQTTQKCSPWGTPNCKNVGGPLGAKQLKMLYKWFNCTEHNNPPHPCNTEKPKSNTTNTVGHTQTEPHTSSDCQTHGKILQI